MRGRGGIAAIAAGAVVIGALMVGADRGDAAFPGDNGLVVYNEATKGPSRLFTVDSDGNTGPVRFTDLDDAGGPGWSPDGRQVAFDRYSDGNAGLWVAGAGGAGLQRLTTAESDDYRSVRHRDPAWSPDGTQLALQHYVYDFEQSTVRQSIAVVAAEAGATPAVIVSGTAGARHGEPVWSPDGTRIAFVTSVVGTSAVSEDIWTVAPSGDDLRRITSSGGRKGTVDWSPDSTTLVYQQDWDDSAEIMMVDPGGGTPRRLTNNSHYDALPVWSPDGTRIAFVSGAGDGGDEIRVMDVDGSNESAPIATASQYYRIYSIDWQALEPPPEPTTTEPAEETEEDPTTSVRTPVVRGTVTNPLPAPAPEDGAPALFLDRTVTRTGTVVVARGADFPPLAVITLHWEPGLGDVVVGAGTNGAFERSVLVMPRDTTGPRRLVASVDGEPIVDAPLLVVLGPYQPSGNQRSLVTRR